MASSTAQSRRLAFCALSDSPSEWARQSLALLNNSCDPAADPGLITINSIVTLSSCFFQSNMFDLHCGFTSLRKDKGLKNLRSIGSMPS
jgi:hypothetical protein